MTKKSTVFDFRGLDDLFERDWNEKKLLPEGLHVSVLAEVLRREVLGCLVTVERKAVDTVIVIVDYSDPDA